MQTHANFIDCAESLSCRLLLSQLLLTSCRCFPSNPASGTVPERAALCIGGSGPQSAPNVTSHASAAAGSIVDEP